MKKVRSMLSAPGTVGAAMQRKAGDRSRCSFDIWTGEPIHLFLVDAVTGEIVEDSSQSPNEPE